MKTNNVFIRLSNTINQSSEKESQPTTHGCKMINSWESNGGNHQSKHKDLYQLQKWAHDKKNNDV
jgi:hypothetical protein